MRTIEELLREHRFFEDLPQSDLDLIAGCGRNEVYKEGLFIAREGEQADKFWVIRHGKLAVETQSPGSAPIVLETLGAGEVVGWSWLFPPYRWTFDVRVQDESRVVALDARCLREKAEYDAALGYRLMKSFARVMAQRLQATRLQLLDIYGQKAG